MTTFLPLFVPPKVPSREDGSGRAAQGSRDLISTFGDGYEQRAADGLNPLLISVPLVFAYLQPSDATTLCGILNGYGRSTTFAYTLPWESSPRKFRIGGAANTPLYTRDTGRGLTHRVEVSLQEVADNTALPPNPPTVTGISPNNGSVAGGTSVTITGTAFTYATAVTIGGVACTGITIVSDTEITATTPAGSVGTDDVVVTNPGGTGGTGDQLWTYTPLWYNSWEIGSTLPSFFADTTTEGTTNHYFYNSATYGSFSALLTAIGATFARSSSKYITNASGNLAQISSGVLPFDYSPTSVGTPVGLLLEGASTNLFYPSNATTSFASVYGATISAAGTGPDGVSVANLVQNGSGTNYYTPYQVVAGLTTSNTYVFSLYAKAGTAGGWLMMGDTSSTAHGAYFNLNTGTLGNIGSASTASITSLGNGWYRCSVAFPAGGTSWPYGLVFCSSNGEGNYGLSTFTSASENGYFFGVQLELASVPSSYIPTTSGTASRAADNLNLPWTATTFTSYVEATLAAEVNGSYLADAGNGLLTEASGPNAQTSNGTNTLSTGVNAYTSQNVIVVGGSSSGRVLSANGAAAATDAHALVPSAPTKFYLGQSSSNANQANGHYTKFGLWSVAATAAQAASLSGTS